MTTMIRNRARRRAEAQLTGDLADLLSPAPRASLPGVAWRWRYELAVLAGAAVTVTTLLLAAGVTWTVIITSALLGMMGPPWTSTQRDFAWRIVTAHRLRTGFAQARIQSRRGRLPVILRTTSQPFGERARVWCPAGTSAEDIRSARTLLRAACWAADVRVIPDERRSHLVIVDVIRRQPWPDGVAAVSSPAR